MLVKKVVEFVYVLPLLFYHLVRKIPTNAYLDPGLRDTKEGNYERDDSLKATVT